MSAQRALRALMVATLVVVLAPIAKAAAETAPSTLRPGAAPTRAEVMFYTQPLVKARLRAPDSLHAFAITGIAASADDPLRFEVQVRFRAKTPFGAITEHSARFHMKRSTSSQNIWIVTSE